MEMWLESEDIRYNAYACIYFLTCAFPVVPVRTITACRLAATLGNPPTVAVIVKSRDSFNATRPIRKKPAMKVSESNCVVSAATTGQAGALCKSDYSTQPTDHEED